jgi:oligopeptidase B
MSIATPPVAAKKPHSFTHHGITVTDDYAWLRDPGYPEVTDKAVLAHLEAENAWFESRMADRQPVIDALFREMRGRIKEADKLGAAEGRQLALLDRIRGRRRIQEWWRRPVGAADDGSADELILDEVALAEGLDYFRLGAIAVSNDGKLLAWSVDDNGSERFTARIKVIATGEVLPDEIPARCPAWSGSRTIGPRLFARQRELAHRQRAPALAGPAGRKRRRTVPRG